MKLPTDPKQRMQMFGLIGAAVVIVLGLAIYFGIMPFFKSRATTKASIADLTKKNDAADKDIRQSPGEHQANFKTLSLLKEVSEKYFLKMEYDNYFLGAKDAVMTVAAQQNLEINIVDRGLTDITLSTGKKAVGLRNIKGFTAEIQTTCSYKQMRKLIVALEESNPYLVVTLIRAVAEPDKSKDYHRVSISVQWPTWSNKDMPAKLDALIQAEEPFVKREDIATAVAAPATQPAGGANEVK